MYIIRIINFEIFFLKILSETLGALFFFFTCVLVSIHLGVLDWSAVCSCAIFFSFSLVF